MIYAAHESAISEFGKAVLKCMSDSVEIPNELPEAIEELHINSTLALASMLQNGKRLPLDLTGDLDLLTLFRRANSSEWANYSILMRIDGNAWPDKISEWLRRIDANDSWMNHPWDDGSETLNSKIRSLLDERNRVAHGERPVNLQSLVVMEDWVEAFEHFSKCVKTEIQVAISRMFPSLLTLDIGEVDLQVTNLGESTVPFLATHHDLEVGVDILAKNRSNGSLFLTKIKSMQSSGLNQVAVLSGSSKIAVSFNRPVSDCDLFLPV